ncbi:CIC11C00000000297 [Sungouiella intermedia]|uniref:CIC11C00000000297 n=1 Tax=Sungouiella intermedia TaxID=45354 RepID=A0A1L0C155_9ASCO|nr:CIC11C00000000297 [[Candida] intermedia]
MSKLDTLLAMVDSLSTKSDRIVSSICESNDLIGLILEVNGSIAAADSEIDTMTELINKNNICLNEFEKTPREILFLGLQSSSQSALYQRNKLE